jgi:hypothetical protein
VSSIGKGTVEASIDLEPLREELHSFYVQIQIWSLDAHGRQFIYTPIDVNWFEYIDAELMLQPISFPMERQGLSGMLQKDGMKRWPLVHLFVNGRPVMAVRRYDDQNGVIYVPIRALDETDLPPGESTGNASDPITIRFHQHEVQVRMDQNQATQDGKAVWLPQKIQTVDNEPVVPLGELQQLFNVTTQWDEAGSALFIETL